MSDGRSPLDEWADRYERAGVVGRLLGEAALELGGAQAGGVGRERGLGRPRGLTPGDFANVLRQARLSASSRAPQRLVELLAKEVSFREQRPGRRSGFV